MGGLFQAGEDVAKCSSSYDPHFSETEDLLPKEMYLELRSLASTRRKGNAGEPGKSQKILRSFVRCTIKFERSAGEREREKSPQTESG